MSRAPARVVVLASRAARSRAPSSRCAARPSGARWPGSCSSDVAQRRRQAAQRLAASALYAASSARVRQLAVHQQVGDLLELAACRRSRGCRSRGSAGRCRCVPTVHSAVLPAATPDSATDFLGLGIAGAARSWLLISCEQLVELLLVVVVAEVPRRARRASASSGTDALLRALRPDRLVDLAARPCSWRGTPTADTAPCRTPAAPSSVVREQRRLAELGDVGEHRHLHRVARTRGTSRAR